MSWLAGCQQLACLAKQPAGRVTGWRAGAANPTRNETDITNLAHELYMNRDINLLESNGLLKGLQIIWFYLPGYEHM